MKEKRKNIILITVDCLRADHVKYMRKIIKEKDKVFFKYMFSNATYTGLSIPSLLSSFYPPIEEPRTTITVYLKEQGYQTAAFVPNALLLDSRYRKLKIEKGFDLYKNYLDSGTQHTLRALNKLIVGLKDLISRGAKYIPKIFLRALQRGVGYTPLPIWLPYPRGEYILLDAIKWIEKIKKPFFVWIHLMDAHAPYLPPDDYLTMVDKKTAYVVNKRLKYSRRWLPKEDVDNLHQLYIDSIRYIDAIIYEFLYKIDRDNTIILLTADHGEQFLEHGKILHPEYGMYDEQLHIPLFIFNEYTGNEYNGYMGENNNLCSLIDIAPTIAQMVGLETYGFVGETVFKKTSNKIVFFAGYDPKWRVLYGVRTKEWKLFRGIDGWELYNVLKDPKEKRNIYNEEEEKALQLKTRLLHILEKKRKDRYEKQQLKNIHQKIFLNK